MPAFETWWSRLLYSGLGHWTNGNAELVLFGKRVTTGPRGGVRVASPSRISKRVKQIVMAPRGKHSQKPDAVPEMIVELLGDVPRIELFARSQRAGWVTAGDEVAV